MPDAQPIPDPPPRGEARESAIAQGAALFAGHCSYCHGVGAISGGTLPDLRRMQAFSHDNFELIVRGGLLQGAGMPRFDDVLSAQDVEHIHAYLTETAHEDHALRNTAPWLLRLKKLYYELVAWAIGLFFAASAASA